MNASTATERKSFLPLRLRSPTIIGSKSTPTASHSTTPVTTSMPLATQNDSKSPLTVGNRVLVNGLKRGILRYIGSVQFAQGLFCGVELDEPEGKHDGQVNDIRYFQCKSNHGIFVPRDKVILTSQERAFTIRQPISHLRPPTMTRSMTISSTINNKIEQIPIKTSVSTFQLPDIIPSRSTSIQPVSIIKTINNPIITDKHEMITPTEKIRPILKYQPLTIDEPPETIEPDFTDSVSLILHHLQPEEKPFLLQPSSSTTISEEGVIDDDDEEEDDDIDELDNGSTSESFLSEKIPLSSLNDSTKSIQTDLSIDVKENITIMKNNLLNSEPFSYSNKSLSSSATSINKLKINPIDNKTNINKKKPNLPTPIPVLKKVSDRTPSIPSINTSSIPRKLSLISPKKGLSSSTKSMNSFGSQSKFNQSPSSSNSLNSSHSDLTSNHQITSDKIRSTSHSVDLSSNKTSDVLDHHLTIQKIVIQSLESTNEYLKKQYQHLLNQFDLMSILSQYYINKNEQIKQEYELKRSKLRIKNNQFKNSIDQLKISHNNELMSLNEQNEKKIQSIKQIHQQEIDKLFNEKTELETRCTSLQEQVDRFNEEIANSEYADPLLRRVEILEKDRTSLQTVVELRTQELTQLRTKINEQVFQREDQLALQKRIDMVENRNEDLVCLLRNWQLNEKVVTIERDQLKERLAQFERDNRLLIFENETLLYSLRQRSPTIGDIPTSQCSMNYPSTRNFHERARSFSSIITLTSENERLKRSLSLNYIFNR